MVRKIFIIGLLLLLVTAGVIMLLAPKIYGATYTQKQLAFVDEFGDPISHTTLTSVTIYDANTDTESTLYNRDGSDMTNAIVTGLASNQITFWSKDADYKCTATDGTYTRTVDNLTGSQTRFAFPTYLVAMSARTASDDQTYVWGTDSDALSQWIDGTSIFRWWPKTDGVSYDIGSTLVAKQFDFHVYVGGISGGGLTIDEDTGAFTYVSSSGTIAFDATGSGAFGVHTGAATGAITLGSETSGAIALNTTAGITVNADNSIALTTTETGADITIDATDGSILIDSGENAASAISLITNKGTSETIVVTNTKGTGAGAIDFIATAGGIKARVCDEKELKLGNAGLDAYFIVAASATAGSEDVRIVNTNGTDNASIALTSTAGGITAQVADGKNLTLGNAGGDAYFIVAAHGTAGNEDVRLINTNGTDDASIELASAAGGITLNAAAGSIDIEAVGGTDGDIGINAGDDMTVTVAGDLTYVVTGSMVLPNNILLKAVVDIDEDEIDAIETTPIELVAAVAGKVHEFVYAIVIYDYNSVPWTESNAPDDMVIRYHDTSGAIVSALIDATATGICDAEDTVCFVPPVSDIVAGTTAMVGVTAANCTNKKLVLHNTGAAYTNDGDGALRVITYYRSHTTAELGL